ncbi:MAG: OpgC domain-containing protein [Chloroflexota bacterium]
MARAPRRAWRDHFNLASVRGWRYIDSGGRDLRLDLLRGYAVFAMICDHSAGSSWLTPITGGNRFVTSAAEGFVLLAGLVIGMVYGRRIQRDGWLAGAEAIFRRAIVLYLSTVGLTLLFAGLFRFTSLKLWVDRTYGLGLTDPVELIVGTLTLHYTYHGTDILWMYTILISASPIVFLLLATGRLIPLLLGSWVLWLAYQVFPAQAAIPWTATNVNYFPIAAWQVLFIAGMAIGYHRDRFRATLKRAGLPAEVVLALFAAGLGVLIAIQRAQDTGRLETWPGISILGDEPYQFLFDKASLAPGRLLAFAIVAGFGYTLITMAWLPLSRGLGWLLTPLGTASLKAYGLHLLIILVIFNFQPLARQYDQSALGNTVLQLVTVGATWLGVGAWRWLESGAMWAWLPASSNPRVAQPHRLAWASAVVAALSIAATFWFGPIHGYRPTTMEEGSVEAALLQAMPAQPARHAPIVTLLVLHAEGENGPSAAAPLLSAARDLGWAVVAPTVPYGDWQDPDAVAGDAAANLPRLAQLVEGLDEHLGEELHPQALVIGFGRGAITARQLLLFYPRLVAAAATVGPAPCTLPVPQQDATRAAIQFPFGPNGVASPDGQRFDVAALARTAAWIGLDPRDGRPSATCPFGAMAELDPTTRATRFADSLRRTGATVEVYTAGDEADDLRERALAFLARHAPTTP